MDTYLAYVPIFEEEEDVALLYNRTLIQVQY